MSSRRQRIKAVTNLPVRRGKPENTNSQSSSSQNCSESDFNKSSQECSTTQSTPVKVETLKDPSSQNSVTEVISEGNSCEENVIASVITSSNSLPQNQNEDSQAIKQSFPQNIGKKVIEDLGVREGERIGDCKALKNTHAGKENVEVKEQSISQHGTKLGGWRRPKPTISLSSVSRRRKDTAGNEKNLVTDGGSVEDHGVKINSDNTSCAEEYQSHSETSSVTSESSSSVSITGQKRSPEVSLVTDQGTNNVADSNQYLQRKLCTDINSNDHLSKVDSVVDVNLVQKPFSPKKKAAPRPNVTQVRRHRNQSERSDGNSESSKGESECVKLDTNVCQENKRTNEIPEEESYSEDESRQSTISEATTGVSLDNQGTTDCESFLEDEPPSPSGSKRETNAFHHSGKRRKRSNSTNKRIVEAKRDFEARFANKKPDRNSLRMFDLIYYNPSTNPMKSTQEIPKEVQDLQKSSEKDIEQQLEEENVDNPDAEASVDSDDFKVPAPRVKVGPDGEIVLDEQSLVIETTESKRSKKEIANLTVVVDTGSSTTYSTYSKKRKKSRSDWNEKDTILFYKALQTIGTDFSLMQTLFPSRTRLDLKAKFKKEERINRQLIEKALRFPLEFDLTELEKEQAKSRESEENTRAEKVKTKKPAGKKRGLWRCGLDTEDYGAVPKKRKRKSENNKDTSEREDTPDSEKSCNVENDTESNGKRQNLSRKVKEKRKRIVDDDYSVIDSGFDVFADDAPDDSSQDIQSSTMNEDDVEGREEEILSENEEGITHILPGILQSEADVGEDGSVRNRGSGQISAVIYDGEISSFEGLSMNNIQPGSLVLFTAECPENPGYHVCNVFMVQEQPDSPQGNKPASEDTDALPAQEGTAQMNVVTQEATLS